MTPTPSAAKRDVFLHGQNGESFGNKEDAADEIRSYDLRID